MRFLSTEMRQKHAASVAEIATFQPITQVLAFDTFYVSFVHFLSLMHHQKGHKKCSEI